jgi:hypothetical protein
VYNIETGEWEETQYLSEARSLIYDNAKTVCGKAYFAGGGQLNLNGYFWEGASDVIDIYDPELNIWTIDNLTHTMVNHTVAGLDDHLFVAGGQDPAPYSLVEIYIDPDCIGGAVPDQCKNSLQLEIYPNPSNGQFNIEIPDTFKSQQMTLTLFNPQGQKVYQQSLHAADQTINVELPDGVYVMQVRIGEKVQREMMTITK